MKHNVITVGPGSPYEGRMCPVTKQNILAGTSVVICPQHDSALAEIVFHEQSRCPMCYEEVQIAVPASKPPPKPSSTGPAPSPTVPRTHVPSGSPVAATAAVAAMVSLLVIGAIGALGVFTGLLRFGAQTAGQPAEQQTSQVQVVTAVVTQIVEPTAPATTSRPVEAIAAASSGGVPDVLSISPPEVLARSIWGGRAPGSGMLGQSPVRIVLTHEESGTLCCDGDIAARIAANERIHRDRGWADIAWHFIVAPDGRIYQGRDPTYQTDSAYARVNSDYPLDGTIVVGILGNYNLQSPTAESTEAVANLLAWLCQEYNIASSDIYYLRDLAPIHPDQAIGSTTSPGSNMPNVSYFRNQVRSMTGR